MSSPSGPAPGPERLATAWAARIRQLHAPPVEEVPPVAPGAAEEEPLVPGEASPPVEDSSRRRGAPAKTVGLRAMGKKALAKVGALFPEQPEQDYHRPKTRGECEDGQRPCPFVSCRFHLYLDVKENGSIRYNFPDLEVWEMPESCVLDLAARDGMLLEEVGVLLNLTRERVRQLETRGLGQVARMDHLTHGELAAEAKEAGLVPGGPRRRRVQRPAPPEDMDDVEEEEHEDGNDE